MVMLEIGFSFPKVCCFGLDCCSVSVGVQSKV
jgi:hypothetical protein